MKSFAEFLRLDILYIVPVPSILSKYHRFHGTCVNSIFFKPVGKVPPFLGQFALNSQTFPLSSTWISLTLNFTQIGQKCGEYGRELIYILNQIMAVNTPVFLWKSSRSMNLCGHLIYRFVFTSEQNAARTGIKYGSYCIGFHKTQSRPTALYGHFYIQFYTNRSINVESIN
jgi:hypothetical protein